MTLLAGFLLWAICCVAIMAILHRTKNRDREHIQDPPQPIEPFRRPTMTVLRGGRK